MRMSRSLVVLAVAIVATVAWAAQVNTDWDHEANFSEFHSFAWAEGTPMSDPLMEQRMVDAVNAQLEAKGLKKMDAGADLWVAVHTAHHNQVELESTGFGAGWGGWGRFGGWGNMTTSVDQIPVGTMLVDLVNAKDSKLVWRATASEAIPTNPQKATEQLNKVIAKMFQNYPPQSK